MRRTSPARRRPRKGCRYSWIGYRAQRVAVERGGEADVPAGAPVIDAEIVTEKQ